jgi:hypothetical protein
MKFSEEECKTWLKLSYFLDLRKKPPVSLSGNSRSLSSIKFDIPGFSDQYDELELEPASHSEDSNHYQILSQYQL